MITAPDAFYAHGCGRCARFQTEECSARIWQAGLSALRGICLAAGLSETAKWGHPCFTHAGRNIAMIGAFRGDFRLTFFNAALLEDPEKILEKPGPHSQSASLIRFQDDAAPERLKPVILAYLEEAKGYAERGVVPARTEAEFDLPVELSDALDADSELAEAFAALTKGRQRSYVIALASAKTTETRIRRIERFRERILAGKGAQER